MKNYRRIEVNAFRRRVTIVSGEWRLGDGVDAESALTDERVSLNDSHVGEPVTSDSPEGQLILIEAMRCLERRLSPEARATIRATQTAPVPDGPNRNRVYLTLKSFYQSVCPTVLRFARKEK